jgi:hypothetical protein
VELASHGGHALEERRVIRRALEQPLEPLDLRVPLAFGGFFVRLDVWDLLQLVGQLPGQASHLVVGII